MQFKVLKSDLIKELNFLSGVVDTKGTIPIFSHVLFTVASGMLRLSVTNSELGAQSVCKCQIASEGYGTVAMKKLFDLVKLLPEGDIEFTKLENNQIQITYLKKRYKMLGLDGSQFPVMPEFPKKSKKIGMSAIASLIRRTSFAISEEESRYNLNGALIILQKTKIGMVTTDGHRLSLAEVNGEFGDFSDVQKVLIPKDAIAEIRSISDGADDAVLEFASNESMLFFRCGTRNLMARQLTGQFPAYEAVLPKDNKSIAVVDSKEFLDIIARVSQLADSRTQACKFKFSSEGLEISTASKEYGEGVESMECEYTGDPVTIGFNSSYFADFLNAAGTEKIIIKMKDDQVGADIAPLGDDKYRYILMPMRV